MTIDSLAIDLLDQDFFYPITLTKLFVYPGSQRAEVCTQACKPGQAVCTVDGTQRCRKVMLMCECDSANSIIRGHFSPVGKNEGACNVVNLVYGLLQAHGMIDGKLPSFHQAFSICLLPRSEFMDEKGLQKFFSSPEAVCCQDDR